MFGEKLMIFGRRGFGAEECPVLAILKVVWLETNRR